MVRLRASAVAFLALAIGIILHAGNVQAHGGGLDRYGCHNDRRNGGYHCHRGSYSPRSRSPYDESAAHLVPSPTRQLPTSLMLYSHAEVDEMLARQKTKIIDAYLMEFEKHVGPLRRQAAKDKELIEALNKQNTVHKDEVETMRRYIEALKSGH